MNNHSQNPTSPTHKASIAVELYTNSYPNNGGTTYTNGNKTLISKTTCPLPHQGALPLMGKGQPTNVKWTGIYSLANTESDKLATNAPITLTIDFQNQVIRTTAPLTINTNMDFMLDATFDKVGNVNGKFFVNTADTIEGSIFIGKISKDCIHLEISGNDSEGILCAGGIVAFP